MSRPTKKERAIAEHLCEATRAEMANPAGIAPWAGQKRETRRTWYALARVLVAKLGRLDGKAGAP